MKGDLYWAPVDNPQHVLDIGTGTGIWAIQFAQEHPSSTVVGTDLSLIQPSANIPQNLSFIRADGEEPWVFDDPFDFVHLRSMCSCFNDARAVMDKIYDNLVPGGWCEYQDGILEFIAADQASEETVQNAVL